MSPIPEWTGEYEDIEIVVLMCPARGRAIGRVMDGLEKQATKELERLMKLHELGPWVERTTGIGLKQAARFLAAVGDLDARESVAQVYAYLGLHTVVLVDHSVDKTQPRTISEDGSSRAGDQSRTESQTFCISGPVTSHPGDHSCGNHQEVAIARVAPRRVKGQKANWNSKAKSRAWLMAEACMKQKGGVDVNGKKLSRSPYRDVYETTRDHYADAVHAYQCQNSIRPPAKPNGCGTREHPEWGAPGSPLRDGHIHARAMRAIAKAIIKDMFLETKRIRSGGQATVDPHVANTPAPVIFQSDHARRNAHV